jgi:hypothetical protein
MEVEVVVEQPRAPRRRPVPSHPPARRLRALIKAAPSDGDRPSWETYTPFVQPSATHDDNGVPLRRSSRRASREANVKRVFRTTAYNAVAEGLYC